MRNIRADKVRIFRIDCNIDFQLFLFFLNLVEVYQHYYYSEYYCSTYNARYRSDR